MADKTKILIVDNDARVFEPLSAYLSKEWFDTQIVRNGTEALRRLATYKPDLVLLDAVLPGMDGYDTCKEMRKTSSVPIIMLSAKGEVFDKVLGLELGADDYVTKPYDSKELLARIKAVLRRYTVGSLKKFAESPPSSQTGKYVEYPDLTINLTNYSVVYRGKAVEMPPKELELFHYLASHPNQVFTREHLLDHIWGYEYVVGTRTVDVHIKRLREKIKEHATWKLSTVWGVGYKFEVKKR